MKDRRRSGICPGMGGRAPCVGYVRGVRARATFPVGGR